jgi:predicted dehydrogenase
MPGIPNVQVQERELDQSDALLMEINSFVEAIQHAKQPQVSGRDGRMALETALKINKALNRIQS